MLISVAAARNEYLQRRHEANQYKLRAEKQLVRRNPNLKHILAQSDFTAGSSWFLFMKGCHSLKADCLLRHCFLGHCFCCNIRVFYAGLEVGTWVISVKPQQEKRSDDMYKGWVKEWSHKGWEDINIIKFLGQKFIRSSSRSWSWTISWAALTTDLSHETIRVCVRVQLRKSGGLGVRSMRVDNLSPNMQLRTRDRRDRRWDTSATSTTPELFHDWIRKPFVNLKAFGFYKSCHFMKHTNVKCVCAGLSPSAGSHQTAVSAGHETHEAESWGRGTNRLHFL